MRNRRCRHAEGCSRWPFYGEQADGRRLFCFEHKMSHHVDVVRKRCREPGCERWPSFASAGATPLFCRAHKSTGDVDVRHKRCSAAGCSREPLYSEVLGTTPRWCSPPFPLTPVLTGHVSSVLPY